LEVKSEIFGRRRTSPVDLESFIPGLEVTKKPKDRCERMGTRGRKRIGGKSVNNEEIAALLNLGRECCESRKKSGLVFFGGWRFCLVWWV